MLWYQASKMGGRTSTYLRPLVNCHCLFRKIYGHAAISYIQDLNLDLISLGEDRESFLSEEKKIESEDFSMTLKVIVILALEHFFSSHPKLSGWRVTNTPIKATGDVTYLMVTREKVTQQSREKEPLQVNGARL
jgi:hypothetical protein